MKRTELVTIAALVSACSTLGTPASAPGPLPHGGTGQFRALTTNETTLPASPAGLTVSTGGLAIEDAMSIEGNLFYAAARFHIVPPSDAGAMDAGMPMDASVDAATPVDTNVDAGPIAAPSVDWSHYDARQIYRSTSGASWGFAEGATALSASAAWEGGYVTDPWVLRRADGRYLLYYSADGGIGVASAATLDGPWMREGSAPIVATSAAGRPRRPSAISTAGLEGATAAIVVYYELGGALHLASSGDGVGLHDLGTIPTMPIAARDDRDGVETSVGAPGAIVVPTPAGRRVVRFYYESRRSNGTVLIAMLGSANGIAFDQFPLPVFAERDRQAPAPRYVDPRTTLLYTWIPNAGSGAVIASVSPAAVGLAHVAPTP